MDLEMFYDYHHLIKKNLIYLMEKYEKIEMISNSENLSNYYRNALLQLPNHPILTMYDLDRVSTIPKIRTEMAYIIDNKDDIEEVKDYISNLVNF